MAENPTDLCKILVRKVEIEKKGIQSWFDR